jgi:CheY-like chemotaxis protein
MNRGRILDVVHDALRSIADQVPSFPKPPAVLREDIRLSDLGISPITGHRFSQEMLPRIGLPINFQFMLANQAAAAAVSPSINSYTTLGHLVDHIMGSLSYQIPSPEVVYVDDEEENLFVFKRKFGKKINLVTFDDPGKAKNYILSTPNVVLVLTDEAMPIISGNQLRDLVHQKKPSLKFVLITGNPGQDQDLLYKSLKGNRFFDFFLKPLDLEGKGDEYFRVIQQVLNGDFF